MKSKKHIEKAIKNIEQSNKIREKFFKKAREDKNFMKDLAKRNPQMVMDAKGNWIGPVKEIKKTLPLIQEQLARYTGRMPINYTPIARAAAQTPMKQVVPIATRSSILKQLAKLSPLATLQSDSELQESFPDDDDLNFPSILEELISEPR